MYLDKNAKKIKQFIKQLKDQRKLEKNMSNFYLESNEDGIEEVYQSRDYTNFMIYSLTVDGYNERDLKDLYEQIVFGV